MAFTDPGRNIAQFGIAEGMRVADFGAGSGHYALHAAKKVGPDGRVYAIDIQEGLLHKLKDAARHERLSNLEVLRGDLDEPGGSQLADNFVDVIIISNILFQAEKKDALMREAYRILKPGGRALLIDWTDSFGGMGPSPEHVVPQGAARERAEAAGFSLAGYVQAGAHHYGMMLRK